MANYTALVPLTGYISIDVEADSEEEALSDALARAEKLELTEMFDLIEEWDTHEVVVEGNISHAILNRATSYET